METSSSVLGIRKAATSIATSARRGQGAPLCGRASLCSNEHKQLPCQGECDCRQQAILDAPDINHQVGVFCNVQGFIVRAKEAGDRLEEL